MLRSQQTGSKSMPDIKYLCEHVSSIKHLKPYEVGGGGRERAATQEIVSLTVN